MPPDLSVLKGFCEMGEPDVCTEAMEGDTEGRAFVGESDDADIFSVVF